MGGGGGYRFLTSDIKEDFLQVVTGNWELLRNSFMGGGWGEYSREGVA